MDLEAKKLHFIEEFLKINDVKIIDKLEKVINISFNKTSKKTEKPMSLEEFTKTIDISHKQHLKGETLTEEEVDTLIDSWK